MATVLEENQEKMAEYIMKSTSNGWGAYVGELIRCKDCEHCIPNGCKPYWYTCDVWERQVKTDLSDYCSRAERKEE
jgi:hypothetical protein